MMQKKNIPNPLMVLACRTQPSILSLRARARIEKNPKRPASQQHIQGLNCHFPVTPASQIFNPDRKETPMHPCINHLIELASRHAPSLLSMRALKWREKKSMKRNARLKQGHGRRNGCRRGR